MNYTYLKYGDVLPSVGVIQKLLNKKENSKLKPDGIFGPRTRAAVQQFQKSKKIAADGIVGIVTWSHLVADINNLSIIDCVDVFDKSLYDVEVADIRKAGGNPLLIGGMSNGVEQAVRNIIGMAKSRGVFLLRFHGHGSPGSAGISKGKGYIAPGEHLDRIHMGNLNMLTPVMQRLSAIFSPHGCIQFMHCSTGQGPNGENLLRQISNHVRVPVTAARLEQFGGGLDTFRFEGPTFSALPGGINLKTWCENLPDF